MFEHNTVMLSWKSFKLNIVNKQAKQFMCLFSFIQNTLYLYHITIHNISMECEDLHLNFDQRLESFIVEEVVPHWEDMLLE